MRYAVGEFWAWARGRRRRFRVEGASMEPLLAAGSFALIDPSAEFEVGDIVVVAHPSKPLTIIKRLGAISADGFLDLRSDNVDHGSDSRHFGTVDPARVIGTATLLLDWPLHPL